MSKYHNVAVHLDGRRFASKAEARRYQDLCLLLAAGSIRDLVCQPRYPLCVNGKLVSTYVADFSYYDVASSRIIIEDVKGVRTALYQLKKKLMGALYGVTISEIR